MVSRRASLRATPSLSRIPAEERTISDRAQKVTPEPKGRQRPWRQVTTSGRSSRRRANSASRRLLPMPGSPTTRAQRGLGGDGPGEQSLEGAEFLLAADELTGEVAQFGACPGQGRGGDPGAHRLRLALESDRVTGVEAEDLLSRCVRGLADGDGHRRRRALQAGGDVDGVAGEEPLARWLGRRPVERGPRRC